jgi:polysaccharide biosynthesis/export protein
MLRNGLNGLLACLFVFTMSEGGWVWAQALSTQAAVPEHAKKDAQSYVVGPDDQVTIWVLECDEITGKTFTIDKSGSVSLPLVGRMHVAGFTVEQFEVALRDRLHRFLRDPEVSITVTDFRSQPVSVIGAVNRPGVYQLRGGRTLLDALTEAGGLRADAGTTGRLERDPEWGRIPLADATTDPASGGSVAEINIRKILASGDSEGNIDLRPHDVISVPASEMVYVIGEISKPGSFAVHENGSLSILQAISMAGGLTKIAAPSVAKILRPVNGSPERAEIPVDITKLMAGKSKDVDLLPNDILLVPDSSGKKFKARAIDTAISLGSSLITLGLIYK